MGLKNLDALTALSPGADLWIVADLGHSKWTRKIDWYLNFQLMRAEPRKAPEISDELRKVMDTWEFDPPTIAVRPTAPLMVASSQLLPNSKTVMVPFTADAGEWVRRCHQVWMELQRPSLRLFLPEALSNGDVEKAWPKSDRTDHIEFVSEKEIAVGAT